VPGTAVVLPFGVTVMELLVIVFGSSKALATATTLVFTGAPVVPFTGLIVTVGPVVTAPAPVVKYQ